jgi:hypothetical protein
MTKEEQLRKQFTEISRICVDFTLERTERLEKIQAIAEKEGNEKPVPVPITGR